MNAGIGAASANGFDRAAQRERESGRDAAVLPMRKNVGRQIQTLEAEGFTRFEKVYSD